MDEQGETQQREAAYGAVSRQRQRWVRKMLGSLVLLGLLVGLMFGRLFDPAPVAPTPTQVEVALASWQGPELQMDREPVWQRSEHPGAIVILLPAARLAGESVQGSLQQGRQRGSWRVVQTARGVEVLLVSLAGEIEAQLLPRQVGQQWRLAVQVRLLEPDH